MFLCRLASSGTRRDPPAVCPAPAPCTARWRRCTQTRGRWRPREPRGPDAGPLASACTWPSGLQWAAAAAGMGAREICCPGRLCCPRAPTTSFDPEAPETTVLPRLLRPARVSWPPNAPGFECEEAGATCPCLCRSPLESSDGTFSEAPQIVF